ncbi:MAG: hypothetical protein ACREV2_10655 [Burkholderiales bacterium]
MNKQFWISGMVMSVVAFILSFVVHGLLLGNDYSAMQHLYRTPEESQGYFGYMILAHVLFGFALTWIYRQGVDAGKPLIGQGVRFGIAVALLMTIPTYLIYYAVQPLPGAMVVKQIVFDTIAVVLLGIIVALLNRPATT